MAGTLLTNAGTTSAWWDTWMASGLAVVTVTVALSVWAAVALSIENRRKASVGEDEPVLAVEDFRTGLDEIPEVLAGLASGWVSERGDDAMTTFSGEGGYQAAEDAYCAGVGAALLMRHADEWGWKPPMGCVAEPGARIMDVERLQSLMNAHRNEVAAQIVDEWEPFGETDSEILETLNAGFTRMAALQIVRDWFEFEGDFDSAAKHGGDGTKCATDSAAASVTRMTSAAPPATKTTADFLFPEKLFG